MTSGERRFRDARECEAALMREAISAGRKLAVPMGPCR